jgi:Aspartyl/Asparaginyl beta-hydroxylase
VTHFQKLASGLAVFPLLSAIDAQPKLFKEISGRQDYQGSAHQDTKSIFLRWCKDLGVSSAFTEIPAFDYPAMGKLPEAQELIQFAIRAAGGQKLGRVLIVSLRPGGVITPHADEGAYADHYERFHIVLKSESVIFKCADEWVEMEPGDLYWFNHKEQHEVASYSKEPRVHMIIDMVAPKFRRERTVRSAV